MPARTVMNTILIIEDDAGIRQNVLDLLEAEGFAGLGAESGEAGIEIAVQQLPDLIICDVAMPGIDGYEVFEVLSSRPATAVIPFIFLSARAERADVRRGMALGADDYLTKPFTRSELLDSIRIRLKRRRAGQSLPPDGSAPGVEPAAAGARAGEDEPANERLIVVDPAMRAVMQQVDKVAKGMISVLILGETGVGKELVAEEIHRRSGRSGRFVPLNCAALTESLLESELFGHEKGAFTGALRAKEGLFEAAHGGTLFLDEAGELPATTQAKLLRVLEERKVLRVGARTPRTVDVRFVAATNRDIESAAEQGSFRQDLYYRLNGISIAVPPLRDRPLDIAPLATRFIAAICGGIQRRRAPVLSRDALSLLTLYAWPGNIRELRNVLERAVLLCDGEAVLPAHLPAKLAQTQAPVPAGDGAGAGDPRARLVEQMERIERERIIDALARCAGNQTQAAELLGISRRTLQTRLTTFDLPRPRKRAPSEP